MQERIVGRNAVLEALRGVRKMEKILFAEDLKDCSKLHQIRTLATHKRVPIFSVEREEINLLAPGENHQGVLAYVEPFSYTPFDHLLSSLRGSSALLLLLDGVEDPQNLGTLLRCADAAGADGLIITKRRSVGVTAAVCKVSAGAVEYVPVAQVSNLSYAIERLKDVGFWIVGAAPEAEKVYYQADLTGNLGIVLGSEGKGLSRLVKKKCDFLVKIPMYGSLSSLNVAVAGALLMYEARRQRTASNLGNHKK